MQPLISPKQVAQAIGVSESSLKRWCDQGLLATVRTPGGHRRLARQEVIDFLRRSGHKLVQPALLGLPSTTGQGEALLHRARQPLVEALLAGDEEQCRRIVLDLYLARHGVGDICDHVLAGAFHDIGDRWQCGEAEVYQERRACGICGRILTELRSMIPTPVAAARLALGGTPEQDPYTLPTAMAEVVLRAAGWQAQSLGARLPMSTIQAAIVQQQPLLCWLSVSHLDDEQRFIEEYREFYARVRGSVAVVVGGRALTENVRRQMEYAAFCDNMQHLSAFAAAFQSASAAKSP